MEIVARYDGVVRLNDLINKHLSDDSHWLCSEVWARIAIPVQAAFILIENTVNQTLRGLALIITGCLTFSCSRIFNGFTDLFVMTIQLVALPVIGIASFLIPKMGQVISNSFKNSVETNFSISSKKVKDCPSCLFLVLAKISDFILGLFSIPTSIVRSAVGVGIWLFSFKILRAVASLFLIIKEPIVNFGMAIIAVFNDKAEQRVDYSLRAGYLYNPKDEFKSYNADTIHAS